MMLLCAGVVVLAWASAWAQAVASSGGVAARPERSMAALPLPPVLWQLRHVLAWMAGTASGVKVDSGLHPPASAPPSATVAAASVVNSIFICAPADQSVR